MDDAKKKEKAKSYYEMLCNMLENDGWKFDREDDNYVVHMSVSGESMPIQIIFIVDEARQLIRLLSPVPFKFSEEKRMEGAIAAGAASFGMADGNFGYDLENGHLYFKITASYIDSEASETLFRYMLACTCAMVDRYNDKFLALDKGVIDLAAFIDACK